MVRLTELAQQYVSEVVRSGDIVIDATAGNGYDTLFLAQRVGPTGQVIACDIQQAAIDATRERLTDAGICHVELHLGDHSLFLESLANQICEKASAVMFNLGYLPGGDKSLTTTPVSTVNAVSSAVKLLRFGGILTVLAYVGHPGGAQEAAAIENLLNEHLERGRLGVRSWPETPMTSAAPRLYVLLKT